MGGDREGTLECESNGLMGCLEKLSVVDERKAPTEEGEQGGYKLEALLQRHEDALVGRIEVLFREQAQALRKEFRDNPNGGAEADNGSCAEADKKARETTHTTGPPSMQLEPEEPEPVYPSETADICGDITAVAPEVVGRRRGSIHGTVSAVVGMAPDMMTGALELRKKLKGKMVLSIATPDKGMAVSKFREKHPIRGFMRVCTLHPFFDTFFAAVVVFSVVLIGCEIEVKTRNPNIEGDFFLVSQVLCCILFFVELFFRVGSQGLAFLGSKDYKWNVFDLVCLTAMVLDLSSEVWLEALHSDQSTISKTTTSSRIVRVLRLLRIIRALRIMRATRTSREFRKMSYALQYSAQTLFWALLLLGFVMYFFAATFTQATGEVLMTHGLLPQDVDSDSNLAPLVKMYGSIPHSFQSLFYAIASGRDWHELVEPIIEHLHWAFASLYFMFISVTIFGIMNVLTSVFVESALQSVQHYKDLLIQESVKAKKMYVDHLREVFREIDTDGSGSITLAEMEQFLTDPALMLYLESMDIQPDDARTLFSLLDKDDSGCVSIEEFCQGCLRLKGDAKSFDIHCIIFENHRLLFKWKEYMAYMDTGLIPAVRTVVEDALDKRMAPQPGRQTFRLAARPPSLTGSPRQGSPRQLTSEPGCLSGEGPEAPPAPLRAQMMSPGLLSSPLAAAE